MNLGLVGSYGAESLRHLFYVLAVLTLVLAGWVSEARANVTPPYAQTCEIGLEDTPEVTWTDLEKALWKDRVCIGLITNVTEYFAEDPNNRRDCTFEDGVPDPEGLAQISRLFLMTILTVDRYKSRIRGSGINLKCFRVTDGHLDFDGMDLSFPLVLSNAHFEDIVFLTHARGKGHLNFDQSKFSDTVYFGWSATDGIVSFRGTEIAGDLVLEGARIGGNLSLGDSKIGGDVFAPNIHVQGEIYLYDAEFGGDVNMARARTNGGVNAIRAKIQKNLYLSDARIGGLVSLDDIDVGGGAEQGEDTVGVVNLHRSFFDGSVQASGARLSGTLSLDAARIGADLFLNNGADLQSLVLTDARVQGVILMNRQTSVLELLAARLRAEGGLLANGLTVRESISLEEARIDGSLWLPDAFVKDRINLGTARIAGDINMGQGFVVGSEIAMNGALVDGVTRFTEATRLSLLNAERATFGGGLLASGIRNIHIVNLAGAKVGGDLDFSSANSKRDPEDIFEGPAQFNLGRVEISGDLNLTNIEKASFLNADQANIGSSMSLAGSDFADVVSLNGIQVAGNFDLSVLNADSRRQLLSGADVSGPLVILRNGRIGSDALIGLGSLISHVEARGLAVSGTLDLRGAVIETGVDAEYLSVSGGVFFGNAQAGFPVALDSKLDPSKPPLGVYGSINLSNSLVEHSLRFYGGTYFGQLDLSQGTIGHELWLGSPASSALQWGGDPELSGHEIDLTNTHAAVFEDHVGSWAVGAPIGDAAQASVKYQLNGFTFEKLGGPSLGLEGNIAERDAALLLSWLGNQTATFSPQPYEHLASHFEEMGRFGDADEVRYAALVRGHKVDMGTPIERAGIAYSQPSSDGGEAESGWFKSVTFFLSDSFFGHGKKIERAFWVSLIFVAIGTVVYALSKVGRGRTFTDQLFFSVDLFIPIIRLNEDHYNKDMSALTGLPKYYLLYLHQLVGLVVLTVVAASVSGIAQ